MDSEKKICITSQGDNLDSEVAPRFGRCQYFIIVDTDTLQFEAIENSSINMRGGAGIQSAQLIASKDVKIVLTGNVGPNAFTSLQSDGIEIITGISGTVRETIKQYKKGLLKTTKNSTVDAKSGINKK
jgi:predicted Fe-Mo cluster-binding NifX family protein